MSGSHQQLSVSCGSVVYLSQISYSHQIVTSKHFVFDQESHTVQFRIVRISQQYKVFEDFLVLFWYLYYFRISNTAILISMYCLGFACNIEMILWKRSKIQIYKGFDHIVPTQLVRLVGYKKSQHCSQCHRHQTHSKKAKAKIFYLSQSHTFVRRTAGKQVKRKFPHWKKFWALKFSLHWVTFRQTVARK